ncbi:hypothetical protein BU24DRAFT_416993 [Aaosphaeria arxii CBS 175.79]|uniref:Aminoglycoside phosphotransferase domain-containing protein n=1 Tax=Aaosphaeria arxii CBS 175.79 TaxID=1450172 RepID=A0A6A5Y9B3_9PLEO|nr:uncharacterized protein BU24DRAFT_416993 [Aaosphaeria arxii CBS 175.79]KAF2021331.1 hypothetical protein BU24DRAFT_416993 [Aaosphaeria arxii CBS 175.79]
MESWYDILPNFSFNVRKHICQQAQPPTETPPCSACSFILDTERNPYAGGQNTVFALRDHAGKEICMRIQHSPTEGSSYVLEKEVNFRKAIESAGVSGFQKVIGCATRGNDLIPAPFITLE